jgi:hypothetical protein
MSEAARPVDQADLDDILAASRRNNPKLDVTGILLFENGIFLQFLEGPPDNVEALYHKIRTDSRHSNVMILLEQPAAKRRFSEWSMAFQRPEPGSPVHDGFSAVLEKFHADDLAAIDDDFTLKLLALLEDFARPSGP